MDENQKKSLDLAIKQLDKAFGKGTLLRLGDKEILPIETISTGSLGLDLALGVGGLPKGRVIEIYGPESSGKTTLTLHAIAQCQKAGGVCAFIDAEHALDVIYAKNLGVDTDNLLVSQPDFGEQALEILETVIRSGAVDLIVIDSVAALTPKIEIDGDMDDVQVGLQARLMSKAGSWFSYNDSKIGQGKENSKVFLRDNPEIAQEIENKILEAMGKTN